MVLVEICVGCYFDGLNDDEFDQKCVDRANEGAIKGTVEEVLESKGYEEGQYKIKFVPSTFARHGEWLNIESYSEGEDDDELSHSDVNRLEGEIAEAVHKWVFDGE